jgi:hypothetical protein
MRLLLLGTQGCHLCEHAELRVDEYLRQAKKIFTIEYIDIAEQQQWLEKYASRIPVLYHQESLRDLGWPFKNVDIDKFVNSLK